MTGGGVIVEDLGRWNGGGRRSLIVGVFVGQIGGVARIRHQNAGCRMFMIWRDLASRGDKGVAC